MRKVTVVIGAIVLTPVLLVAGGYVVSGIVGTVHVAKAKRQAADDIERALPASDAEAARHQVQLRGSLSDLGSPSYSWRELHCDLSSNDAGWIVQNYEQDCRVRSVDLIPVAEASPGDCETLPSRTASDAALRTRVSRGPGDVLSRPDALRSYCADGLTGPPRLGVSRVIDGERPGDLTSSPGWVVAETTTPVSRTELGCSPWGVIFCESPVDEPVMG